MDGSGTISRARGLLHRLERALAALDRCLAATHGTLVACAALVLVVLAITPNEWRHEGRPDSDALFYIAQKHQLEGASERDALDRVFSSKEARNTAAVEDEGVAPRVLDPAWQDYSKQFYERRWLVPALASGLDPLVGADLSFEVSSLIAYMLLGPLLFLLLRLRFPPGTCAAVALACLLLPPVRKWMVGVNVDAWGLVLLVAAVLSLMLVRERGLRWLAAWIPAMAALSLTRDATLVAACAALALLVFEWRRPEPRVRNAWLVASGAAAAAPALLLGGAPVRENIAYIIDGYRIPADDSGRMSRATTRASSGTLSRPTSSTATSSAPPRRSRGPDSPSAPHWWFTCCSPGRTTIPTSSPPAASWRAVWPSSSSR